MDTFMDKLAQRLNAQEMIRANSAAEVEEMDRLKDRVSEYNRCLDDMQKAAKDMQQANAQVKSYVEASLGKLDSVQKDNTATEELGALLKEALDRLDELGDRSAGTDELLRELQTKVNESGEDVHKECVKVYRNVQAVVTEEAHKQSEGVSEMISEITGGVRKANRFAVLAFIAALIGVILQVLQILHIL